MPTDETIQAPLPEPPLPSYGIFLIAILFAVIASNTLASMWLTGTSKGRPVEDFEKADPVEDFEKEESEDEFEMTEL